MTNSQHQRRRYGRTPEAHKLRASTVGDQPSQRVGIHLWPDAYQLLEADAAKHGLTLSGWGHHIIRTYYSLPPLP